MSTVSIHLFATKGHEVLTDKLQNEFDIQLVNKIRDAGDIAYKDTPSKSGVYNLFLITPELSNYDVIVDLISYTHHVPVNTVFFFLSELGEKSFGSHQLKSLVAIGEMVRRNKAIWCEGENQLIDQLRTSPDLSVRPIQVSLDRLRAMNEKPRVFLGGTVNGSTWREKMMDKLEVKFFNPVVKEWNEKAQKLELLERERCDYNIYIITPLLLGYYSLAEIIDDSFKKPGQTIYCFLNSDQATDDNHERKFTSDQITSLRKIGRAVELNGGIWCKSLNEVITFFNSIQHQSNYYTAYTAILKKAVAWHRGERKVNLLLRGFDLVNAGNLLEQSQTSDHIPATVLITEYCQVSQLENRNSQRDSVFISYGRRKSWDGFVWQLYEELSQLGIDVWFDKKSILTGKDFRDEIRTGIERAGNFIFLISNKSCTSSYCQQELETAKQLGKRIIPILHDYPIDDTRIDVDIRSIHREEFRENGFDNFVERQRIIANVVKTIGIGNHLVIQHTQLLGKAFEWKISGAKEKLLLGVPELDEAQVWLKSVIKGDVPCTPIRLQTEFISESKRQINNDFVDAWFCTDRRTTDVDSIAEELHRHGMTVSHSEGHSDQEKERIIKAVRFIFFITPSSINDKKCLIELNYARKFNIPIVPLILEYIDTDELLTDREIRKRRDFSQIGNNRSDDVRGGKTIEITISLVETLIEQEFVHKDFEYYNQIRYLRHKCFTWNQAQDSEKRPFLIHGKALSHYWDIIGAYGNREYVQTQELKEYLTACEDWKDRLRSEVYISYHHAAEHFAFGLNEAFNKAGKTTWNDHTDQQVSARSAVFYEEGIKNSANIVVVATDRYFKSSKTEFDRDKIKTSGKKVILVRPNPEVSISSEFSKYKLIDFDQAFELSFQKLLIELNTDHDHNRKLNEIAIATNSWLESGKSTNRLLRGDELVAAKAWLITATSKNPSPTSEQLDFVREGLLYAKGRKRQRIWFNRALIFITILAFSATLFSIYQSRKAQASELRAKKALEVAEQNETIAKANRRAAEASEWQAQENAKIAHENAERARINAEKAERNARDAEEQRKKAITNAREAEAQRENAIASADEAKEQEIKANEERKKALKSDSTARVLKRIETGKRMALLVEKLVGSGQIEMANNTALAAYDSLALAHDEVKIPFGFDALCRVYDHKMGDEFPNVLLTQRTLTDVQISNGHAFVLTENGHFLIRNVQNGNQWGQKFPFMIGASSFSLVNNQVALVNRYGEVFIGIGLEFLKGDSTIKFNKDVVSAQIHKRNSNISSIIPFSFSQFNKDVIKGWITSGFDGDIKMVQYKDGVLTSQLLRSLYGKQIWAMDIQHLDGQIRVAVATSDAKVHCFLTNLKHSTQSRVLTLQDSEDPCTSIKFLPARKKTPLLLMGTLRGRLKGWDLKKEVSLENVRQHDASIISINVRGSELLTGSRDGVILIRHWNGRLDGTPEYMVNYHLHGRANEIVKAMFWNDELSVISMDTKKVKKWTYDLDWLRSELSESNANNDRITP